MKRHRRRERGASMMVIVLMTAFMIILPLGLVAWEILRFSLGQQELRSVCDASALSGAAAMASVGTSSMTLWQQQNAAMDGAINTFRQNSVFDHAFSPTNVTANKNPNPATAQNPPPGQAVLNIVLLKDDGTQADWATGAPTATIASAVNMRIEAYYGYVPPLISALGFGEIVMSAVSSGGLPELDVVLCFDISGSMDDNTPVSFVKRWWNPAGNGGAGCNEYDVVPCSGGTDSTNGPMSGRAQGKLYYLTKPVPTGTGVNVQPPQNLDYARFYPEVSGGEDLPYFFDVNLRSTNPTGSSELGLPPGNVGTGYYATNNFVGYNPPDHSLSSGGPVYTDLVTNLDGNIIFGGWTDSATALTFQTVGALVEASRGNLDDPVALASSIDPLGTNPNHYYLVDNGSGATQYTMPAAGAGYKNSYFKRVNKIADPLSAAVQAATNFFNILYGAADVHFGLVAFSDGIGTTDTTDWTTGTIPTSTTNAKVAGKYSPCKYPAGGTGTFPLPLIKLNLTQNNYTTCTNMMATLVATGKTDISDSLNEALAELTTGSGMTRPKATKAIVLFTDGEPNLPNSGGFWPNYSACDTAADNAASAGIKIHCIGLSQNPAIQWDEDTLLNDIGPNTTQGLYKSVTNSTQLNQAFQDIARALVVLK